MLWVSMFVCQQDYANKDRRNFMRLGFSAARGQIKTWCESESPSLEFRFRTTRRLFSEPFKFQQMLKVLVKPSTTCYYSWKHSIKWIGAPRAENVSLTGCDGDMCQCVNRKSQKLSNNQNTSPNVNIIATCEARPQPSPWRHRLKLLLFPPRFYINIGA